jgi:hypothetical protein
MTTLERIIVSALALWFVIGLIASIFFASGGTTPPERGQGTEVESRR